MSEYRYILEAYRGMNSRYNCPECQHKDKTFSRYIDAETGEHVHYTVGRCNRESNCGYHCTPKQYFQKNNVHFDMPQPKACIKKKKTVTISQKPFSFIPDELFKASLKGYKKNCFIKFLIDKFGIKITGELVSRYFIATSKHWDGATVFWQIDANGRIRTGKIMLYDPSSGKRIKEPFNHITWVHKVMKQPLSEFKQCLFGEHLLKGNTKPVAIVESEKTAIIASVYLPQFIWLAVGSLTNLNAEKCKILRGRTVILFPDLNGFEKWSEKAKELSPLISFAVSGLLERKANEAEKAKGLDIADYLLRFDLKDFQSHEKEKPVEPVSILIDNILLIPTETITGPDFENMNIVWIKTKNGSYDVLFDTEGEPVKEFTNTVTRLAAFFEKNFKPAFINGQKCLAHVNKN